MLQMLTEAKQGPSPPTPPHPTPQQCMSAASLAPLIYSPRCSQDLSKARQVPSSVAPLSFGIKPELLKCPPTLEDRPLQPTSPHLSSPRSTLQPHSHPALSSPSHAHSVPSAQHALPCNPATTSIHPLSSHLLLPGCLQFILSTSCGTPP